MHHYQVYFEDHTFIVLNARNENQARLLAIATLHPSPIVKVFQLD